MIELARAAALIGVLGTAAVFGTDVFCAMVQRPALARVDDRTLVAVMGYVHRYGDRRMPIPGVIGMVATAASAAFAAAAGSWTAAVMATAAVALLLVWLTLYVKVSAPINRQLTAAAQASQTSHECSCPTDGLGPRHQCARGIARLCSVRPVRLPNDLTCIFHTKSVLSQGPEGLRQSHSCC